MEGTIGTAVRRKRGFDLAVIGGGVAGLMAAWSAARHGLSTVLFEGAGVFGGQIGTLGKLEDYPSTDSISGVDLATALVDAARESGATIVEQEAISLTRNGQLLEVQLSSGPIRARNVVVATGARLRKLTVPGARNSKGAAYLNARLVTARFFEAEMYWSLAVEMPHCRKP